MNVYLSLCNVNFDKGISFMVEGKFKASEQNKILTRKQKSTELNKQTKAMNLSHVPNIIHL